MKRCLSLRRESEGGVLGAAAYRVLRDSGRVPAYAAGIAGEPIAYAAGIAMARKKVDFGDEVTCECVTEARRVK